MSMLQSTRFASLSFLWAMWAQWTRNAEARLSVSMYNLRNIRRISIKPLLHSELWGKIDLGAMVRTGSEFESSLEKLDLL
jgi:hypothetical protein